MVINKVFGYRDIPEFDDFTGKFYIKTIQESNLEFCMELLPLYFFLYTAL